MSLLFTLSIGFSHPPTSPVKRECKQASDGVNSGGNSGGSAKFADQFLGPEAAKAGLGIFCCCHQATATRPLPPAAATAIATATATVTAAHCVVSKHGNISIPAIKLFTYVDGCGAAGATEMFSGDL